MPYSIRWYVEGRVILERAYGIVSMEELVRFNEEVTREIAEHGTPPVHVIADLTSVERYPPSLGEILSTMRRTTDRARLGWMLVAVQNPVLRFVASVVFQVAGMRLRMFPTVPEALKFLVLMDDTVTLPEYTDEHQAGA
jgi:hypothetical protein